jgi:hypothetical protein
MLGRCALVNYGFVAVFFFFFFTKCCCYLLLTTSILLVINKIVEDVTYEFGWLIGRWLCQSFIIYNYGLFLTKDEICVPSD